MENEEPHDFLSQNELNHHKTTLKKAMNFPQIQQNLPITNVSCLFALPLF